MIKISDHVQLQINLPQFNLEEGEIGFVVGEYVEGYLVEFPEDQIVIPLSKQEIVVVHGN